MQLRKNWKLPCRWSSPHGGTPCPMQLRKNWKIILPEESLTAPNGMQLRKNWKVFSMTVHQSGLIDDATQKELKAAFKLTPSLFLPLEMQLRKNWKSIVAKITKHSRLEYIQMQLRKNWKIQLQATPPACSLWLLGCNSKRIERVRIKVVFISRKKGESGRVEREWLDFLHFRYKVFSIHGG